MALPQAGAAPVSGCGPEVIVARYVEIAAGATREARIEIEGSRLVVTVPAGPAAGVDIFESR